MAASLSNVLASIPGYGAYLAKSQMNAAAPMQEVQQAGALVGLQQKMEEQRQAAGALERNEKLRAAIAALPPEQRTRENILPLMLEAGMLKEALPAMAQVESPKAQPIGSGGLRLPDGTIVPPVREPKAPTVRQRYDGETVIQEEMQPDGSFREIGRGPRFQKSVTGPEPRQKPPPGYRFTEGGDLEAIPGGPADLKVQGAFNADTSALSTQTANLDRLSAAANELLNHPGLGRITGTVGALPDVPGSAAANARAKLLTLKSQTGFNTLQEMRNASKTGGAVGQVTEKEWPLLQSAIATLETAQSEEQMRESLQKIMEYASGAKDRLRGAYNVKHKDRLPEQPGGAPTPPGGGDAAMRSAIERAGWKYEPDKYEYRLNNGQVQRRAKGG